MTNEQKKVCEELKPYGWKFKRMDGFRAVLHHHNMSYALWVEPNGRTWT